MTDEQPLGTWRPFSTWRYLAAALLAVALNGCVVADGGYGGYGNPGYGVDYYEPYGASYGGWGPGYGVAPYGGTVVIGGYGGRGGGYQGGQNRGQGGGGHAYRASQPGRAAPSIPGGGRGGGGHAGGGGGSAGGGGHGGGRH